MEGETDIAGEKRKRAPRTTKKQIQVIVDFLEANNILLKSKVEPKEIAVFNKAWVDLAEAANSGNMGPMKSVTQWKQVINELKTNVKKKARDIYVKKRETGGGPPIKDLNDIESKLYNLLAPIAVEGAKEIIEIGLPLPREDIQKEQCEIDEVTLAPDMDEQSNELARSHQPIIETVDAVPQTSGSVQRGRFTTKRTRKHVNTAQKPLLEKSIECQMKATELLAESICKLSSAIELLAQAISSLAEEIS